MGELCARFGVSSATMRSDLRDLEERFAGRALAWIGGFALVAVPAQYRVTGVKTFVVNYDGVVYQKDLGPDSLNIAKAMELYNPDKTWQATDDGWPPNVETAKQ